MEKINSFGVAGSICHDENQLISTKQALEATVTNVNFENCKIFSKTTKQALNLLLWRPTFDSASSTNWDSKKQLLAMFQNAAKQVVMRNRINKRLSMLRNLKSCLSSGTCINYCIKETADDEEALELILSCQFPILISNRREKCFETFISMDRNEIYFRDTPNHLHPKLPFVYKRLEYYPSTLMDLSNHRDNHPRLTKYVAKAQEFSSTNKLTNNFYGALKSNCSLEMMIGSPSSKQCLLKFESFTQVKASLQPLEDMSNSFNQWKQLPPVFHKFHCTKTLLIPRRLNYTDSFLSSLPLPTSELNVHHLYLKN